MAWTVNSHTEDKKNKRMCCRYLLLLQCCSSKTGFTSRRRVMSGVVLWNFPFDCCDSPKPAGNQSRKSGSRPGPGLNLALGKQDSLGRMAACISQIRASSHTSLTWRVHIPTHTHTHTAQHNNGTHTPPVQFNTNGQTLPRTPTRSPPQLLVNRIQCIRRRKETRDLRPCLRRRWSRRPLSRLRSALESIHPTPQNRPDRRARPYDISYAWK